MSSRLFSLLLLLIAYGSQVPLLLAQTAPSSSFPRYAVGASLFTGRYYIYYSDRLVENLVFNPAELTVSYQFRPRLAVQLGFVWYRNLVSDDVSYTNATGKFIARYFGNGGHTDIVIPVLGRYTLTRRSRRVQFDMLAGLTYLHGRNYGSGGYTDSMQVTTPYNNNSVANNLLLTVGPSIRCALGKHLEAVSDFTFNQSFGRNGITDDRIDLTNSLSLGLRYRFGYR